MTFINFINNYVDDEAFKKTVNSLYEVWEKEGPATLESAISSQPQTTVSTANTPEQNAAIQNGKPSVEPRPVAGDANNMNSEELMTLAKRVEAIEKEKEENEKAALQAQEKIDKELDDVQNTFNAVANEKTTNVVG